MRILLAEDNPANVELFVAALEADGHRVTVVSDGRSAVDRALGEPFDLVVLDIQMPRLDGHAACAELRAAGRIGPIIALSAAAMPDDLRRGLQSGFDAYLTKPIRPAELRAQVRRFEGHGGSGGPRSGPS